MTSRIYSHRMARRSPVRSEPDQAAVTLGNRGDHSRDIGLLAYLVAGGHPHRPAIDNQKLAVAVVGDEGELSGSIDENAVWVVGTRQWVPTGYPVSRRVDRHQLLAGLDRNEDPPAYRIVLGVPCLATQRDHCSSAAGRNIDYDLAAAELVRDEDFSCFWSEGEAVRERDARDGIDSPKRGVVEDRRLVRACG